VASANVELVSSFQAAWNRGEAIRLEDFCHPDVEFLPLRAATEGAFRGLAGLERFIADTLAWGVLHVRARASGIETDIESGGLFEFRDGKVVRWEDFGSKEEALAANAGA
jgi:hypothetical protein